MRLIDADALIPMMKYATTDNEIGVFPIRIGFDTIKGIIDEAPTIERPKGEFEICGTSNGLNGTMYYKCSLCGTPVDPSDKFCRGCGARMAPHRQVRKTMTT